MEKSPPEIQLILGNSNKRFSGVTSTMLQVLPYLEKYTCVAVLGKHHLSASTLHLSYFDLIKLCRKKTSEGKLRVFHARRNDEMLQALVAKWFFKAKIKIVFTSTAQRFHSRFTRWLMSKMDSVITTSQAANQYLYNRADVIIPHGVDLKRYKPVAKRAELWKSLGYGGEKGIGIFGRVRESKGIDIFIKSIVPILQENEGLVAVVCGETLPKDKRYEQELRDLVKSEGVAEQVKFIGKCQFDELPRLFQAVSCVVAASRNEGFGLTVLEALASGTPVVASEAGAWKEVVNDKVGRCVPVGDIAEMRQAIREVLSASTDKMSVDARVHVETRYSVEQEAAHLYEHLMSVAHLDTT